MTVTYGFYNSLAGDRKYSATQMSSLFEGIITDGVFSAVGTALAVTPGTGLTLVVGAGRAWFNKTWTNNDAPIVLNVALPDMVLARIDAVVLEVDTTDAVRANSIKVLTGTPSSIPVAPTLTNTLTVHQYLMAIVAVPVGATGFTGASITNRIGTTDCPYVNGVMASISTDVLLAQWNSQFTTWFNAVKGQLSTDPASNLQNQINVINPKVDGGWIEDLVNTWAYSSVDGPTGVFSVPADLTAKISNGMRLKYKQAVQLTAYWSFDTNSTSNPGGFTMGNIGTPTYSAGKFSNALTLNGTNQALSITDTALLKPTTEFTIGMWVKLTSTATWQCLFASHNMVTNTYGISVWATNLNIISFAIGNNTSATDFGLLGKTNIVDNVWHYIVCTFHNNYAQIYVDGNLDGAGYAPTPIYHATNYIRIGCFSDAGTNNFWTKGQIDDLFFINNYALDEQTIRAKYRSGTAQGTSDITVTKMAIVTAVAPFAAGATLITAYHGNDFSLTNVAISNPCYSMVKIPFGFIATPDKWTVFFAHSLQVGQASAAANTWYNIGGIQLVVPIGRWRVSYNVTPYTVFTGTVIDTWVTLVATVGEFNTDMASGSTLTAPAASYCLGATATRDSTMSFATKTIMYLCSKQTVGLSTIYFLGHITKTTISSTISYL